MAVRDYTPSTEFPPEPPFGISDGLIPAGR